MLGTCRDYILITEYVKRGVGEPSMNTTFVELVVDGDIVDLNRIPPPADTPIMDERFLPIR
jgi:hypothetical protein